MYLYSDLQVSTLNREYWVKFVAEHRVMHFRFVLDSVSGLCLRNRTQMYIIYLDWKHTSISELCVRSGWYQLALQCSVLNTAYTLLQLLTAFPLHNSQLFRGHICQNLCQFCG